MHSERGLAFSLVRQSITASTPLPKRPVVSRRS